MNASAGDSPQAAQHWILSSCAANAGGQPISDAKMLELVKKWVLGATVSQSADGSIGNAVAMRHLQRLIEQIKTGQLGLAPRPLTLHAVYVRHFNASPWAFEAQDPRVKRVRIQVFDTAGRLVMDEQTQGSGLQFNGLEPTAQRLANGVYVYWVTVYDLWHTLRHAKPHKWVMLR